MTVNGIIAEYNPFHQGHHYQLEESIRLTNADYTIVVMSGNFVQRGGPALLDKHTRAEMALRCGADLVLELPALYSTASAEYFAGGGVALLDKLGVVTHLCFGSECGDVELLKRISEIMLNETPEYSCTLKRFLKQGFSYPNARTWAIMQHYPELTPHKDVFSSPNNILGIEYCKSISHRGSNITPVTIKRLGAGYHESRLGQKTCSALAIRQALFAKYDLTILSRHMPDEAAKLLLNYEEEKIFARLNDFSSLLYYKLLLEQEKGYEEYLDISSDLSERIKKQLRYYKDFESFCDLLKTKDVTFTRVSRCLLHILLNITKTDMDSCKSLDYTPYARVLGFRKDSTALLSAIKEHSSIPLISKLADADKLLDDTSLKLLRQDILISEIYNGVIHKNTTQDSTAEQVVKNEYTTPIVIV